MSSIDQDNDSILEDNFEFESYYLKSINSLTFESKSLDEWSDELQIEIPANEDFLTLKDINILNNQILNITEIVYSNLAKTKSTYYAAKANHSLKIQSTRKEILSSLDSTKRAPSADLLEKMCLDANIKSYRQLLMCEIIYEFWNTQSYKLSQIQNRMTTIGALQSWKYKEIE